MNCPQRWNIRKILSIEWESGEKIFFQIQCQVHRNDPRQILYNIDFSSRNYKFFEFSKNCPQPWNIKDLWVGWESEKKSSKFNVKYIEMMPIKFSTTLIFSSGNLKFFSFFPFFHYFGQKMTKSKKKFCNGKNFWFRDFRFEIRFKTFCIDSD